jgi:hypothetical protein
MGFRRFTIWTFSYVYKINHFVFYSGRSTNTQALNEIHSALLPVYQASATYGTRAKRGTRNDFSMTR